VSPLKSYPAYKDSGLPWMGEVPEHWHAASVKRHYAIQLGKMLQNKPEGSADVEVPYLKAQHVQWFSVRTAATPKMWANPRDILQYGVVRGDLLVCEGGEGGRSGIVRDVAPGHIIQNALHRVRPLGQSLNEFLQYVMSVVAALGWFEAINSKATIAHFTREKFGALGMPVPPLPEQAAIVRYLDHVDRRIRRYIRAKQKLIKLLEEQKQAIIRRAVTRGLDPSVRLKPSGVEWLRDVPEHWDVAALRHRYSQCLGKMLDSKRITGSHLLPYLRNTDVQWDRINIENLPAMDISPAEYDRYTVQEGDLLVCEGGEVGRCAIWSGELAVCGFQKALHRLRPRTASQDVPRFMYYALRAAAKADAFNDGHQSTIAHLTGDKLRAHRFPFPPVTEQQFLVGFLDAALNEVDQAVAAALREISLLREYRTRLIADVVTGKADVREAAAKLADEVREPEPLDEADTLAEGDESIEGTDLDASREEAEA
jgi:type I restriction enzyme, S subunit